VLFAWTTSCSPSKRIPAIFRCLAEKLGMTAQVSTSHVHLGNNYIFSLSISRHITARGRFISDEDVRLSLEAVMQSKE
jgi:hypothetical protein